MAQTYHVIDANIVQHARYVMIEWCCVLVGLRTEPFAEIFVLRDGARVGEVAGVDQDTAVRNVGNVVVEAVPCQHRPRPFVVLDADVPVFSGTLIRTPR